MNYGLILAGGVGQRMRRTGMPKQFLEVFGKPIIIYTLQKFEYCENIDAVVIVCHSSWKDYMESMLQRYGLKKIKAVVSGGKDRQESVLNGLKYIQANGALDEDVIVIHDGVRPLIQENILSENIRVAMKYGNAMTVRPVIESVVITDKDEVRFEDFKKRDDTYSLTAPQSFKLGVLTQAYKDIEGKDTPIPLSSFFAIWHPVKTTTVSITAINIPVFLIPLLIFFLQSPVKFQDISNIALKIIADLIDR